MEAPVKTSQIFQHDTSRPGLVIVFPPGVSSLFNPRVHRTVREVEQRLGDVFVTYALSGDAMPDVGAAVNAARFAGCGSALVVEIGDWYGWSASNDPTTDTLWTENQESAGLRDAVERVVTVYTESRTAAGLAA
jgi:hypothetical protein